ALSPGWMLDLAGSVYAVTSRPGPPWPSRAQTGERRRFRFLGAPSVTRIRMVAGIVGVGGLLCAVGTAGGGGRARGGGGGGAGRAGAWGRGGGRRAAGTPANGGGPGSPRYRSRSVADAIGSKLVPPVRSASRAPHRSPSRVAATPCFVVRPPALRTASR